LAGHPGRKEEPELQQLFCNPKHGSGRLRGRIALAVLLLAVSGLACAKTWQGLVTALQRPALVTPAFRAPLAHFYAQRGYKPLWFDSPQPSAKSDALRMVLAHAGLEGLNPADYLTPALRAACNSPVTDPLACELRLSDSLLRYARDVGYGALQAGEVDPNWHIPQAQLPVAELLHKVAASWDLSTLLAQLPPPQVAYQRLRAALLTYQQAAVTGNRWFTIPDGPDLHPGERGGRVLALRERLGSDQPALLANTDAAYFDPDLKAAVAAFQQRNGLDEDGIVGPQTLAALNVSRQQRIEQLRLNMERWRWLPRDLGDSYMLVNLAGFDLTLVQPDQPPLRMRVINGRPDRTSPALASRISRLLLNPTWTVPRRIAVEEMLPQLKRDPLALQDKNIQVLQRLDGELVPVDPTTVDWHSLNKNNFPFLLRQTPGPHNSLGRIKFVMPNPYDVYIHDTPAKGLFSNTVRTFSHGCIRVEHALYLAARLLGKPPQAALPGDNLPWDAVAAEPALHATEQWLQQQIDLGETENVRLPASLPVYLVYLTAWVDDGGELQFRNDVYRRDELMRDRLKSR
jgi:murein L,D-transpeptidase YcbB/YkuD